MKVPIESAPCPAAGPAEAMKRLADLFRAATYTEDAILGALGGGRSISRSEAPILLKRLPDRGALPALIRLFTVGVPVSADVVARDCAPVTPELLEELGMVSSGPDGLTPRARVHPYAGLLIASDLLVDDFSELPRDYVLGMNGTTASVAAITIRRPVESALDLGTGQGVLALLAARHCKRVVATDINPRALKFAAFNAALNGVPNVEFREGSLFDPVAGETFGLIVSNPPYVVSPENSLQFCDGGSPGDGLCRSIVRGIPERLAPGGFASIRCSWALGTGETGAQPLGRWVEGSGCDALLMHVDSESPLDYAAGWNRLLMERRPAEFAPRLERWLAYFRGLGIERIATGGLVLRKRGSGAPWVRTESLPLQGDADGGRLIERMFEAQDRMAESFDPASLIFAPAPELRIDQAAFVHQGRFAVGEVRLSFARGLLMNVSVDPGTARVITALDGRRTLGEILDQAVPGPESAEARARLAANMARLYALGFLLKAEGARVTAT